MNRRGISGVRVLVVVCSVLAAACSKGTSPPAQQASTPGQPPAQAAAPGQPAQPAAQPAAAPGQPAQPAGGVITSGEYTTDPNLRCDLMEVKRVSGGALLVKWRIVAAQPAGGLTASQPKPIHYHGDWGVTPPWNDLYYIDPAENKKYSFLTDAGGEKIADVFWGDLPAGQQRGNWAKFPAPPPTSTKISVHIPSFPPFEDVAVSQ